jgi:dihydrofolate reductase
MMNGLRPTDSGVAENLKDSLAGRPKPSAHQPALPEICLGKTTRGANQEMAIIGIVAIDRNLAIGKGGTLPWHYSADLKFFKQTTVGNAVVMGSRTWQSLKKPLPDRMNLVLASKADIHAADSVAWLPTVQSVVTLARTLTTDLFVIGGAKTYEAFLSYLDQWIVTEIPLAVDQADTFLPADFLDGFELCEVRQLDAELRVKFYERVQR